jgi:hypothetical protein
VLAEVFGLAPWREVMMFHILLNNIAYAIAAASIAFAMVSLCLVHFTKWLKAGQAEE